MKINDERNKQIDKHLTRSSIYSLQVNSNNETCRWKTTWSAEVFKLYSEHKMISPSTCDSIEQ